MRIICISDTHGRHQDVKLAEADMIIHAGDMSEMGTRAQITDFLNWFSSLDYQYKVLIAGNHDFFLEQATSKEIKKMIPKGVIYLNDSGVEIESLKLWGSPVQPWFYNWAFNRSEKSICKHWNEIPDDTDILITHVPPQHILDQNRRAESCGCPHLTVRVEEVKPQYHIFGHIHESYGILENNGTTYVNSSNLDFLYEYANQPIIIDVNP
ncbi:metallophosphoesterase [Ancylomarina euxinus]|uniref:Metallophosphoesterase n=1 Tax=Ancylomarina euxinus TaxID=2283627 RepID=A0A425Y2G1_9BACT|nr:metallophosphatase domain-containing protein [Ancylomarina euxinus]MCZ4694987.1 metallophosphatase domain-containing protein [Ancylomarina euxinus]MUP14852.1 metallophosphoesterase [Ancylomarina euxinus]RRG22195.1 metallophosphoesterase [Ancylomarina euxinus]